MNTFSTASALLLLLVSTLPLRAVELAQWIAPAKDLVGTGAVPVASGINDWHIRLRSDRLAGITPAAWRIQGGLWYSLVDGGHWYAPYDKGWDWDSLIAVKPNGSTYDFFFEPLLAWPGDVFTVTAVLGVDETIEWKVVSGGEGWQTGARWRGQSDSDSLGWRARERDGIRDWEVVLYDPPQGGLPARVDVWLPYDPVGGRAARRNCFDHWSTAPVPRAMPARVEPRGDGLHVFFNPVLATGGDEFLIRVVWPDSRWNVWKVVGMGSEWETGGTWYGQSAQDYVGLYDSQQGNGVRDWHLDVASPLLRAPTRWLVRGAGAVWESVAPGFKPSSSAHHALLAQANGARARLFFDPVMERAGDVFYVSAVLSDGTMLNWGVTSTRQLRSQDVSWFGQDANAPVSVAAQGLTNIVSQWRIVAEHDKLRDEQPYRWRVSGGGHTWRTPRETEDDIKHSEPLQVDVSAGAATLHFAPVWTRPGDQFDIEAAFNDGTLVQWTAVADGAEWAGPGIWVDGTAADFVGHTSDGVPDKRPDWHIRIADPILRESLALIELNGMGWRWRWPLPGSASPAHVVLAGDAADIYIAPVPGKSAPGTPLTIRAVTAYGTERYWKAMPAQP